MGCVINFIIKNGQFIIKKSHYIIKNQQYIIKKYKYIIKTKFALLYIPNGVYEKWPTGDGCPAPISRVRTVPHQPQSLNPLQSLLIPLIISFHIIQQQ